jgi:hypothetical protein
VELVEPNEGWTARFADIKDKGNMTVLVQDGISDLGYNERNRLWPLLRLVEQAAEKMAWNMVKGVVKYPRDNWELGTWLELGADDCVDALNYIMLAQAKHEADKHLAYKPC